MMIERPKHTMGEGVGGFDGCGSNNGRGAEVAGGDGWLVGGCYSAAEMRDGCY
jgi:hypothetical protein